MEWLSKLIETAQNSVKIAGTTFVFCATILLLRPEYIDFLGLKSFVSTYKSFIALALLASAAILLVELISNSYRFFSKLIANRKKQERIVERLEHLTPTEASVLREFLFRTNVCMFPVIDAAVSALMHDGILERADRTEFKTTILRVETLYFNFRLSFIAEASITPEMLGVSQYYEGKEGSKHARGIWHWSFSDEGLAWIKENRPGFTKQPEKPKRTEPPKEPTRTRPIIR